MAGRRPCFGAVREIDLSGNVYGVFTELSLPLSESLQAQVAYRYEDYGGKVGSTSNAKLSVRRQATDWSGLRALVGSTFRGPLRPQLIDSLVSAAVHIAGAHRAFGDSGWCPTIQNLSGFRPSQNLRLTSRYIDGVTDLRPAVTHPVTTKQFEVGSFLTHDLVYRVTLPSQTTLPAAVINFTNRDPPLVRLELNYDPFIANPIGRSFKLALNKRF